jgi:exodeoxyribonuclease-3
VLKVATYNVNSIRARLERLLAWLAREQPDVVCLQEIKATEDEFPRMEVEAAGWHIAIHGQRTYNGVAILSRRPLDDVQPGLGDDPGDAEARILSGRLGALRVVSVYVPNGQVVGSDKWDYKLDWLRRLRRYLEHTASPDKSLVMCGDLNVAPEDRDVAFPDQWQGSVLTHEAARAALRDVTSWGLADAIRRHHPDGPGPYTWWDYRMLGFAKGNGMRIDHILATRPLVERCTAAYVVREERKGKQPSDHAPVVAVFQDV